MNINYCQRFKNTLGKQAPKDATWRSALRPWRCALSAPGLPAGRDVCNSTRTITSNDMGVTATVTAAAEGLLGARHYSRSFCALTHPETSSVS